MNATSTHSTSEFSAVNLAPPALAVLSARQRQHLATLLDDYMQAREAGTPIPQEDLLADNPSLAGVLRVYLRSLDDLHDMAGGFVADTHDIHEPVGMEERAKGRIGDFELIREVGRGGMGVVYEARQITLDRRVAVKVLPFAAILESKQIARFKTEAQAAAQVQHPNIVPVFAIGVERGVHYYAMEFIDGQPLDLAIAELNSGPCRPRPGPGMRSVETPSDESMQRWTDAVRTIRDEQARFPDDETMDTTASRNGCRHHAGPSLLAQASDDPSDYFRTVTRLGIQAAEALHAAHEHGVVHRDIKPSNLLLDGAGKLWLTDFGLARCRRDVTLTVSGDVVGTLRYMSPEQASGQTSLVDHRTDVYSLGVTLYELACLRAAFPEEHGPELLRRIDSREPPRPREVRSNVPVDLENVILKAMATSRDERYVSAHQMADDLRRVLEGRPTVARPPTAAERLVKWSRRHRRAVAASVAAMLVSLVGLTIATTLLVQQKTLLVQQKLRAEREYHRAESYLASAQGVLDRFGVVLSNDLADVPGAEGVRQKILHSTLQYYEEFVGDAARDPKLQADVAETYSKIAALADQMGYREEAVAAYEEAIRRFERLAKAAPGHQDCQQKLALTKNNFALVLSRAGRTTEALDHFTDAIEWQAERTMKAPEDATALSDLALFYNNRGLLQSELGQRLRAKASFESAVELLERLCDGQPADADCRRTLAAAYNNLASLYVNSEPARAVEYHQRALSLQQEAAAACPEDLSRQREIALTRNNLGAVFSRTDRSLEAEVCYDEALEIQKELARRYPHRIKFQCDLAVSHNNLGLLFSRQGKRDDAEAAFNTALELYKEILARRGDDVLARSGLGGVYHNLGVLREQAGQLDAAAKEFAQAIAHQRKAALDAPEVARFAGYLSDHQTSYNRVLQQLGRHDEAEPL
jgi:serine/threonine protein kinase/tetratricopeptide (TPR) repeat protein